MSDPPFYVLDGRGIVIRRFHRISRFFSKNLGSGAFEIPKRSEKMKKIIVLALAALLLASIAQPAEAGHGHGGGAFLFGLGLGLLVPPLIHAAQPPVVYEPPYYPAPPQAYSPYYPPSERVWVPGYWAKRWNPYYRVWERFWVPGHWTY